MDMSLLLFIAVLAVSVLLVSAIFFARRKKRPVQAPLVAEVSTPDLSKRLEKTRTSIWGKIASLLESNDEGKWEAIEEVLYLADLSVAMSEEILKLLKDKYKANSGESWQDFVKAYFVERLASLETKQAEELNHIKTRGPAVPILMIAGVNGVGKTTTIGKLASWLTSESKKVILAAGDTFRAAAKEQLQVWADRAGATLVSGKEGGDPAAIAFDAVKVANTENADLIIFDTAGRLQNKSHLMEELAKVKRTLQKQSPDSKLKTWMVIDATAGQNGLKQAEEFHKVMDLSGLIITKCDGSSKGGIVLSVMDQWKLPVVFVGVGERVEDLRPFKLDEYLNSLLN
jgi:fused signal recognition particle receptor